ncbi:longitudinals lacking protein, isoforms A/B/D/L isoform X1 [Hyalella azteca]|uniref:Longitudinals lacking protein, isoforms A/B/D/L isoform X1 n=1 Tax=Hyalella azteca TaxID=294128 RepID=A0A8B7NQ58_HYAAZ|nr:longitudinals lacking protein, isoforms A/B/D/L isoform X1 [Hyalella azteca]
MSLGGLLSLKWNNHCSTFLHILSNLHRKQNYDDATVACDGKLYPVHKLVLSTCSEYFEEMFEKTHGKHPVIVLKDIKKEVFEALLKYMYIGEVNVVQEKLAELINAAECLKIKGLAVPDEEPEQLQLGTRNKSNHLSSYSSNQQNSSGNYLNDEHQSANRSLKNTSSSNFSNKRKDFSNLSNINTPPRKIIRASPNVASKNDLAYDSQSKPIQSSDPQESPSRERRGSLASPLSSRSSLDERPPLPTPTSAPSNEDEEIAAWPMAIKDEPTDEPQSEANEGSGACATEFLDRNNGDCKEDEGGAGSAEDALPALPDPAGGEPSGDSQGAAHKDPSDLIDSKVEVGDIEEAPDDWESSLLNKDDEGQEGEALTSMLSGDDASNAAADTPTPGGNAASDDDCVILSARDESADHLLTEPKSPSHSEAYVDSYRSSGSKHDDLVDFTGAASTLCKKSLFHDISNEPLTIEASSSFGGNSSEGSASLDELRALWSTGPTSNPATNVNFSGRPLGSLATSLDTDQHRKISRSSSRASSDSDSTTARDAGMGPRYSHSGDILSRSTEMGSGYMKLPSGLYRCNICSYEAMYASAVKIHLRSHSGEKPYKCPYCPYKSTTSGNVKTHLRKHTGETPFVCNLCNFKAKHKITLKTHMVNVHQITINRYSSYASNAPVQTLSTTTEKQRSSGSEQRGLPQNLGGLVDPNQQDLHRVFDSSALLRHQQLQQQLPRSTTSNMLLPQHLQQHQQSHQQRPDMRGRSDMHMFAEDETSEQIERTLQALGSFAAPDSSVAAPPADYASFASTSVSLSRASASSDSAETEPPDREQH